MVDKSFADRRILPMEGERRRYEVRLPLTPNPGMPEAVIAYRSSYESAFNHPHYCHYVFFFGYETNKVSKCWSLRKAHILLRNLALGRRQNHIL